MLAYVLHCFLFIYILDVMALNSHLDGLATAVPPKYEFKANQFYCGETINSMFRHLDSIKGSTFDIYQRTFAIH